jgi:hypothetical protein
MIRTIFLSMLLLAALPLAGCEGQRVNCGSPANDRERKECAAHDASTKPVGPDTLPRSPKKW